MVHIQPDRLLYHTAPFFMGFHGIWGVFWPIPSSPPELRSWSSPNLGGSKNAVGRNWVHPMCLGCNMEILWNLMMCLDFFRWDMVKLCEFPEEFPAFSNPFTSLVDMSMISSKSPPSSHPSNEAMWTAATWRPQKSWWCGGYMWLL